MALPLRLAGTRAQAPVTSLRDAAWGFEMETRGMSPNAHLCQHSFPGPAELPFASTTQEGDGKMQVGPPSWVETVK